MQGVRELEQALGSRLQQLRAQEPAPTGPVARRVSVMQEPGPTHPAFREELPKVLCVVLVALAWRCIAAWFDTQPDTKPDT